MLGLLFPLFDAGQVGASFGAFTAEDRLAPLGRSISFQSFWALRPLTVGHWAVEFVLARINIALSSGSVTIGLADRDRRVRSFGLTRRGRMFTTALRLLEKSRIGGDDRCHERHGND
jgi:hypothetical protein